MMGADMSSQKGPTLKITMADGAVHKIPLISPLYSVLVGREAGDSDIESYENRCVAAHKWLQANEIDVPDDFMEFLQGAEEIIMYSSDDVPLEGPNRPDPLDSSLGTSSTGA